eukprot:c24657_g1_i2 orf=27-1769(-)
MGHHTLATTENFNLEFARAILSFNVKGTSLNCNKTGLGDNSQVLVDEFLNIEDLEEFPDEDLAAPISINEGIKSHNYGFPHNSINTSTHCTSLSHEPSSKASYTSSMCYAEPSFATSLQEELPSNTLQDVVVPLCSEILGPELDWLSSFSYEEAYSLEEEMDSLVKTSKEDSKAVMKSAIPGRPRRKRSSRTKARVWTYGKEELGLSSCFTKVMSYGKNPTAVCMNDQKILISTGACIIDQNMMQKGMGERMHDEKMMIASAAACMHDQKKMIKSAAACTFHRNTEMIMNTDTCIHEKSAAAPCMHDQKIMITNTDAKCMHDKKMTITRAAACMHGPCMQDDQKKLISTSAACLQDLRNDDLRINYAKCMHGRKLISNESWSNDQRLLINSTSESRNSSCAASWQTVAWKEEDNNGVEEAGGETRAVGKQRECDHCKEEELANGRLQHGALRAEKRKKREGDHEEEREEMVQARWSGRGGQSGSAVAGSGGHRCEHCLSQKTPQWREGPGGPKTLCNACGVRYKAGRLFPEYRPAKSPTFLASIHSNSHKKVLEIRRLQHLSTTPPHLHFISHTRLINPF